MLEQAKDQWVRALMRERELSPTARLLGAVLVAQFFGLPKSPSIDDLAKALCVSHSAAKRALDQLEQAGWLTIPDRPKRGNPPCIILTERSAVLPFPSRNPNHQGTTT
jgi:DNA-binding MarR family transcriptional regulator